MEKSFEGSNIKGKDNFIRLGGLALIAGLLIHVILNSVLKVMPPVDPTSSQLKDYLLSEAETWGIVHGFRYIAFVCVVLFAAALFSRTCLTNKSKAIGWGIVGLLGAAIWVTNGIITNGVEIIVFHDIEFLSTRPDLFSLLYRLTRVLFTAELVTWSIVIFGFCLAGLQSKSIPKWLIVLGLLQSLTGIFTGGFIVSVIKGGWAIIFADVAAIVGLAWFICMGIFMLIRGSQQKPLASK